MAMNQQKQLLSNFSRFKLPNNKTNLPWRCVHRLCPCSYRTNRVQPLKGWANCNWEKLRKDLRILFFLEPLKKIPSRIQIYRVEIGLRLVISTQISLHLNLTNQPSTKKYHVFLSWIKWRFFVAPPAANLSLRTAEHCSCATSLHTSLQASSKRVSLGFWWLAACWGHVQKMCWSKPRGSSESLPIMVRDLRYPQLQIAPFQEPVSFIDLYHIHIHTYFSLLLDFSAQLLSKNLFNQLLNSLGIGTNSQIYIYIYI